MRLPWPFRRSEPGTGAPAPVADGAMQRLAAPVRHDWRAVGTLRPSFAGDPGIRVQRFPDEIAGSQLPPPILAPLGHARTADGPAGLVSGLAHPTLAPTVAGVAGRADLPLRPGRSTRRVQRSSSVGDATADETQEAPTLISEAPAEPVAVPPLDRIEEQLPVLEPRRVAVVAAPGPARTTSLTVARTPDLTLAPQRARIPDQTNGERAVRESGAAPSTAVPVPGTPVGAPTRTILRTASGSRVRLGAPIQRSELATGAPSLGLAHPAPRGSNAERVSGVPSATSVQRHEAHVADDHVSATPAHDRSDAPLAGGLSMTIEDERMVPPSAPIESAPLIPGGLVLARTVTVGDARAADRPIAAHDDGDRWPPAPLVGSASVDLPAPLRPTIPAPNSVPTPITEGRSHTSPTTGRRSSAQRSTGTRAAVGSSAGRTSTTPARGVASGPDPDRPVRIMRSSVGAPDVTSPAPPHTDHGAPMTLALARGTTPMVADANDLRPAARRPALATPITMQRAADDQPTTDPDESPTTPSSASEPSAGASSAIATGGAPAGGPATVTTIADRDLDEMVRRLYPRLRRSLSSELLVARERAGTLADLR